MFHEESLLSISKLGQKFGQSLCCLIVATGSCSVACGVAARRRGIRETRGKRFLGKTHGRDGGHVAFEDTLGTVFFKLEVIISFLHFDGPGSKLSG